MKTFSQVVLSRIVASKNRVPPYLIKWIVVFMLISCTFHQKQKHLSPLNFAPWEGIIREHYAASGYCSFFLAHSLQLANLKSFLSWFRVCFVAGPN